MPFLIKTEFFNTPNSDTSHANNPAKCPLKTYDFPSLIRCALIKIELLECMMLELREPNLNKRSNT